MGSLLPASASAPTSVARLRRFLTGLAGSPEERYLAWIGHFTGRLWDGVAGERLRGAAARETVTAMLGSAASQMGATSLAERYMAADIGSYLPGDLLVKMDIATMAASLEGRSPLLDHELAEFVARLPVAYKVSPFRTKVLLRAAMRGILPDEVIRRGKMGFMAPVGRWLRGPLREMFNDVVLSPRAAVRGYVDPTAARELFAEHASGRADRTRQLWCLLMLELWFTECVEARRAPLPAAVDA